MPLAGEDGTAQQSVSRSIEHTVQTCLGGEVGCVGPTLFRGARMICLPGMWYWYFVRFVARVVSMIAHIIFVWFCTALCVVLEVSYWRDIGDDIGDLCLPCTRCVRKCARRFAYRASWSMSLQKETRETPRTDITRVRR